jgi:aminomethyltransferase
VTKKTSLHHLHLKAGAKMVDFSGWDMPVHYGSQLQEHATVRNSVGMFDVSHMTVLEIQGTDGEAFLRYILANDIGLLKESGKAMYSAMLNEAGGVIDDVIVYANRPDFLMVVNCSRRATDLAWLDQYVTGFDCQIRERTDLSIIALQGPEAIAIFQATASQDQTRRVAGLKPFQGGYAGDWYIARTGYTGEKGLEIILPHEAAVGLWQRLSDKQVTAIGLGARDTLRLEAGMNLWGNDMDESVSPYEANMAQTVVMDNHQFVGSAALKVQTEKGIDRQLIGIIMQGKGVLRAQYPVYEGEKVVGKITSGAFSPTLQRGIALARIKPCTGSLSVAIRGKQVPVDRVRPPFVRHGRPVYRVMRTGS